MIQITINGTAQELAVPAEMPLLWALRQVLHLHGTKFGCGMSLCGACTVLVDGAPVRSCVTPVGSLAGRAVVTIEGATDPVTTVVQEAWASLSVPQCGYCQSGQVLAAAALLRAKPAPTDAEIDDAMDGHVCRCGAYPRIRAAIRAAAAALQPAAPPAKGASPPRPTGR